MTRPLTGFLCAADATYVRRFLDDPSVENWRVCADVRLPSTDHYGIMVLWTPLWKHVGGQRPSSLKYRSVKGKIHWLDAPDQFVVAQVLKVAGPVAQQLCAKRGT